MACYDPLKSRKRPSNVTVHHPYAATWRTMSREIRVGFKTVDSPEYASSGSGKLCKKEMDLFAHSSSGEPGLVDAPALSITPRQSTSKIFPRAWRGSGAGEELVEYGHIRKETASGLNAGSAECKRNVTAWRRNAEAILLSTSASAPNLRI